MVVRGDDELATALEAENQFGRTSDLRIRHELASVSGIPKRSARRVHMKFDTGVHPWIEVAGFQVTDIEFGELLVHPFGTPIRECAFLIVPHSRHLSATGRRILVDRPDGARSELLGPVDLTEDPLVGRVSDIDDI